MADNVWLQLSCLHYVLAPFFLAEYAAHAGLQIYCFDCRCPRNWDVAPVN